MAQSQYRYIGGHADTLANGRPVEPGEFVDLTDEDMDDPFNKNLVADGRLILITEESLAPQEFATQSAREYADKEGVDLSNVTATGATGLITKGDVENYLASQQTDNGEES